MELAFCGLRLLRAPNGLLLKIALARSFVTAVRKLPGTTALRPRPQVPRRPPPRTVEGGSASPVCWFRCQPPEAPSGTHLGMLCPVSPSTGHRVKHPSRSALGESVAQLPSVRVKPPACHEGQAQPGSPGLPWWKPPTEARPWAPPSVPHNRRGQLWKDRGSVHARGSAPRPSHAWVLRWGGIDFCSCSQDGGEKTEIVRRSRQALGEHSPRPLGPTEPGLRCSPWWRPECCLTQGEVAAPRVPGCRGAAGETGLTTGLPEASLPCRKSILTSIT